MSKQYNIRVIWPNRLIHPNPSVPTQETIRGLEHWLSIDPIGSDLNNIYKNYMTHYPSSVSEMSIKKCNYYCLVEEMRT